MLFCQLHPHKQHSVAGAQHVEGMNLCSLANSCSNFHPDRFVSWVIGVCISESPLVQLKGNGKNMFFKNSLISRSSHCLDRIICIEYIAIRFQVELQIEPCKQLYILVAWATLKAGTTENDPKS